MNYTILVTGPAYGTQNASSAFLFCQSLIKTKHKLYSIFFYFDGVLNANKMTTPAIDEFNLINAWESFSKKHQVKLYVCSSAALRRGILKDTKQSELNLRNSNFSNFFEFSGLIELAFSMKICDRIVQF